MPWRCPRPYQIPPGALAWETVSPDTVDGLIGGCPLLGHSPCQYSDSSKGVLTFQGYHPFARSWVRLVLLETYGVGASRKTRTQVKVFKTVRRFVLPSLAVDCRARIGTANGSNFLKCCSKHTWFDCQDGSFEIPVVLFIAFRKPIAIRILFFREEISVLPLLLQFRTTDVRKVCDFVDTSKLTMNYRTSPFLIS